jgi:TolA-binding protein
MPFDIPSWALGIAVIMIAIQIGRAISGKARRYQRGSQDSDTNVDELRQSLDAMQHRVAELEERVDFAERLLAKQRESDRLGGGAG